MLRNRHIFIADLPLIAIAAFGAFALRFDWLFLAYRPEFLPYLLMALVIKPVVFFPFGMYQRYWRYGTALDLVAIALAVTASSVAMAVVVGMTRAAGWLPDFARPVLMIDWLLMLVLAGGLRMSVRVIGDARQADAHREVASKRVLVVGAGDAGTLVVRELRRNPQLGLQAVAFLDDDPAKSNKQILGLPVWGPLNSLGTVLARKKIEEVVIAMPTAAGGVIRAVAEASAKAGISPRVVPGVFELLDGQVTINRLRKVEISDLLRRPQVSGTESVSYLLGRTVLITGAGGSIGGELARQVAFSTPACLVLLGHGENSIFSIQQSLRLLYPHVEIHSVIADVRDGRRLDAVFERFRPDVVFHAAAHKHVPLMEENPEEAITNNVLGTRNVLRGAERTGVQRFVMISTDKAVSPSCVMGASKRLAEQQVIAAGRRLARSFVVVRFGNVLGSRGSVVPIMQAQIERGGPITVTHPEMKRYFMTIPEAVHLVLQAGGLGEAGELFVLNMGEQIRIVDLAADLVRLCGLTPGAVPIEFTGIRAGEKLEEALWETGAIVTPTSNPQVLRVVEPERPEARGGPLDAVLWAAQSNQADAVQASLATALPGYVGVGHPREGEVDATREDGGPTGPWQRTH